MMTDWLVRFGVAQAALPDPSVPMRYLDALRHGTMRLGLYAPRGEDIQKPHEQDELYVIVAGTGSFIRNGERRAFGPHDVLFVEAGVAHRFVDMSDDFAAWVIFWGPAGGEATP
jgi:mannose-6-phosphate isomerase-like protein (cupin superfamily)